MQPRVEPLANGRRLFSTTRWTVILSCRQSDVDRDSALNQLCTTYWAPVFAVLCRRGYSVADAQDLTQEFFADVMTTSVVQHATSQRGRFRSFILAALRNFLADAHDRKTRIKRGGRATFVSITHWLHESSGQLVMPTQAATWPDDRVFDWRWAMTVAERAMARLAATCDAEGARWIFNGLKPYLGSNQEQPAYAQLCSHLGIPLPLLKRLLHKFRRRFAVLLREEIADTVADPADVESELRYLCSILGSTGA